MTAKRYFPDACDEFLSSTPPARDLKRSSFTVRLLSDIVRAVIDSALDESAHAKAGEEHGGDGGSQREQIGDWIGGAEEGCSSLGASQSPSPRDVSLTFPTSSQ